MGNRWYDADTGRFLTRDPARDGSNWWAYVANDPVNAVDPEGLDIWSFQKFIVTGNGYATDLEYEGGLLGLNDATLRWIADFRAEQTWAIPVGTLGAVSLYPPKKPKRFQVQGAQPRTSQIRQASVARRGKPGGTALKAAARGLKTATLKRFGWGKRKTIGITPASLAWFLSVEAIAAWRAGIKSWNEPSGADLEGLVNSRASR